MFDDIRNSAGERLDYAFHPGVDGGTDIVILGHGVTANKDRPFLVALAESLSASGFAVLRMSFAGNGESEGRFEDSTVSKEVADLGAVIDRLDGWRVFYVGHSMGGAVGVLRASRDPRIAGLVSLAGMVHCDDFAQRKFGDVVPGEGFMWDKPECPLSQDYMDDMARIGSVVDLGGAISVPWLLVHGAEDTVVPLSESRDIAERNGNARVVELSGADHVFSGDATPQMVQPTVDWLLSLKS